MEQDQSQHVEGTALQKLDRFCTLHRCRLTHKVWRHHLLPLWKRWPCSAFMQYFRLSTDIMYAKDFHEFRQHHDNIQQQSYLWFTQSYLINYFWYPAVMEIGPAYWDQVSYPFSTTPRPAQLPRGCGHMPSKPPLGFSMLMVQSRSVGCI